MTLLCVCVLNLEVGCMHPAGMYRMPSNILVKERGVYIPDGKIINGFR